VDYTISSHATTVNSLGSPTTQIRTQVIQLPVVTLASASDPGLSRSDKTSIGVNVLMGIANIICAVVIARWL